MVSSVSASSGSVAGGVPLTFAGNGFAATAEGMLVTFSDAGGANVAQCEVDVALLRERLSVCAGSPGQTCMLVRWRRSVALLGDLEDPQSRLARLERQRSTCILTDVLAYLHERQRSPHLLTK